jgi:uncharacterized tellurite resistance protein B-like protein
METKQNILLSNYTEQEKTAYITALAALATSDREASDEELENLREVSSSVGLSAEQEETIMKAAQDTSGRELIRSLDVLKDSDLRYGLITDLIAMAKADESYTQEERGNIEKVSRYLNVNDSQFSILDQFVNKAADEERTPEEYRKPDFLRSTGMQDKFSNAGFSMGSMGKSIFGFLAPIILSGIAGRTLRGRNSRSISNQGGGLGGMLGSILSGSGSPSGMSGGLGGLLTGLARSRSNGSMGGLLGRLLR